jgi:cytochrome c2
MSQTERSNDMGRQPFPRNTNATWLGVSLASLAALFFALPAVAQDAARGSHVFKKCALCHVLDPKAKDLLAPPLHDIVGRKAGQIPGFQYSDIMKLAGSKGLLWSPEALQYFLDRPEEFMPGTYMAFSGLEDQERRDVIAYLQKITLENAAANAAKEVPAKKMINKGQTQIQTKRPDAIPPRLP